MLLGLMQAGRTRKSDVQGGCRFAKKEPAVWMALTSAASEHPTGLWKLCDKIADSEVNPDLLLQTLFRTTGLSKKPADLVLCSSSALAFTPPLFHN